MTLDEQQKKKQNQIPCNPFVINRLRLVFRTGPAHRSAGGQGMPLQLAARSCEDATRHSTLEYALSAGFLAVSAEPCSQMLLTPSKASGSR